MLLGESTLQMLQGAVKIICEEHKRYLYKELGLPGPSANSGLMK